MESSAFFFKKEVPATPIHIAGGGKIHFETVDNQLGYAVIGDPNVADQLRQMQLRRVGGVMEIGQEEYEEFVKKKSEIGKFDSRNLWREEITPGMYAPDPASADRAGVAGGKVGVNNGQPQVANQSSAQEKPQQKSKSAAAKSRAKADFKPKTGKSRRK